MKLKLKGDGGRGMTWKGKGRTGNGINKKFSEKFRNIIKNSAFLLSLHLFTLPYKCVRFASLSTAISALFLSYFLP